MIQGGLIRRKGTGVSPRTLNICLTVLRNVLRGVPSGSGTGTAGCRAHLRAPGKRAHKACGPEGVVWINTMIIPEPPSEETRQKDYDSLTVSGKRMDAISLHNHPFAATCLGHRWAYNKADLGKPLITKLRPHLHLINSGEPNKHFIRDCGVCE